MKLTKTEYQRLLTSRDTKTLSQKALKVQEEVGELGGVVLPYESAHATTHRFADRMNILEEVCDVILTASSIAFELGFSDDDIEEILHRKSIKWDGLQARDEKARYPLPYEIHVTVLSADVEQFRADCTAIGVKPILLDLHLNGGDIMKDMMTSSVYLGNNPGALAETDRIADGLASRGYTVVRKKIETVPWHPAAPSADHQDPVMPKNCYFESHIGVICSASTEGKLRSIIRDFGAHVSRNVFKRLNEDTYKLMVTHRKYTGTSESFRAEVENLNTVIAEAGFTTDSLIIEFSVYDTKIAHDAAWIASAA